MSRLSATLLIVCAACAHEQTTVVPLRLGSALAALPDRSVDGIDIPKGELLQGKVVMVSFIASWCFPCLADLPVMAKLQNDLGPKGYRTIAVGMDLEGPKVLREFVAEYEMPYPVVMTPDELRKGETIFGHISELPTRFLFDRDGTLVLAFTGVAKPDDMIKTVTGIVEKSQPP